MAVAAQDGHPLDAALGGASGCRYRQASRLENVCILHSVNDRWDWLCDPWNCSLALCYPGFNHSVDIFALLLAIVVCDAWEIMRAGTFSASEGRNNARRDLPQVPTSWRPRLVMHRPRIPTGTLVI